MNDNFRGLWCMQLLDQNEGNVSMKQVEDAYDDVICRCTGIYKEELDIAGFDVLVDIRGIQGLYSVNMASWAGNLMLKHLHPEFQSDVYVSLEAANVKLIIADSTGSNTIPISQFLKTDMTNKVIVAMEVPAMTDDYIVRLYKVAQRAEYILDVVGDTAGGIYRSGAIPLSRPFSSGQQSYDTKPLEWPLTEPMIKLEAMDQACFLQGMNVETSTQWIDNSQRAVAMVLGVNQSSCATGQIVFICRFTSTGGILLADNSSCTQDYIWDSQTFTSANRWKKKGLSVVPMKFEISYIFVHYNAIVNIYAWDGSISIAHGGVEMGQGINTKEYKPPMGKDIPIDFRIQLLKNAPNPKGVLRSKDGPTSVDKLCELCLADPSHFVI
ncbi:XDH [Mytilus coruscus]|uniref:XDH n=1 Tax=Mytilus coruscus TaxID=42192 RepID=A0A6J8BRU3_MYTCO|nr:XDH [Mytilus coruscus]